MKVLHVFRKAKWNSIGPGSEDFGSLLLQKRRFHQLLRKITMSDQPTQNNAGCSARSVQMPDTLHIDLPHADLDDVSLIIGIGFIQLKASHWDLISVGATSYELITLVGNLCMDIVQSLAEAILDVVMPQVFKYMRTYGTFPPSVLGLTEDRHLSTDETGQTEQHQSTVIRRIAASASSMCSSIRKTFSCFARALRGPFSASVSPEEERTPTPTGGETNADWGSGDQHRLEERRRRRS
ncbi:hypothetical protein GBF38_005736 [Nibea albiflora]|uniref:Uncharacterized protein n=1 Tax=Nibea albiflora TaxID=240163 RepID=A0ACB7F9U3_NIBAL|nr:hypothetical protein GBF38_005736 [Nibea albiflora]